MTDIECGALQDRMPDVASGAAAWTAAESHHLARCADCALEWRIVSAARHLGDSAARSIDPAATATKVMAGVRRATQRSRWRQAGWLSGLAAAAVVVVVLRTTISGSKVIATPDSAAVAAEPVDGAIPMAELDALDADQLQAVLEHLDAAAGTTEGGTVPRMGDLDDQQLESVLRSLEG